MEIIDRGGGGGGIELVEMIDGIVDFGGNLNNNVRKRPFFLG